MKSHKIWRLEFVSNKIEGEDSKREVMCIYFDHPTKKNRKGELELHASCGEPAGEGGGREEGEGGAAGGGCMEVGGGEPWELLRSSALRVVVLFVRGKQEGGRRREEKEKKRRREGKKEKEKGIFSKLGIF
jgi:hypothetical protein